ncbi:LOW QUALITY PROTEIN: maestro heat-like repeat-containing protein family member 7 [Chamaea fasciata]|uniref:LOW QUALITY PROTEIN: maestro heat-like repeat-containing protein family member 7 n=1 Tax=Chamaea fasciata TaxID=190680 RepID=UPI00336A034D
MASLLQLAINPDTDMAEKPPCPPKNVEKSSSAALPQQQNEMEQLLLLQKGKDRTQQLNPFRRCWRSIGQMFTNITGTWYRGMIAMFTKGVAEPEPPQPQSMAPAPNLDCFGERVVSSASQVPGFVRNMRQRFLSGVPPDDRLFMDILRLTDAHPNDVAVTLLHCDPSCDRGAAIMWKTIASSGTTLDKVMPTLLRVMEGWPLHKMYTSDGDNKDVFALAATGAVWEILRLPWCPEPFIKYSPHLIVALLFQVFVSTEEVTEDVNTFWRRCQEEHQNLPTSINRCSIPSPPVTPTSPGLGPGLPASPGLFSAHRFAVNTLKSLFCHLRCLDVLVAMERKCGWDTLLSADTHHYAVGLLAREMHRTSTPFCSRIGLRLLRLLSREESQWDLSAVAFLVEILECLDLNEWGDSILEILTRYLRSESMERSRLALRGLLVFSKNPSMAKKMCSLSDNLVELLKNEEGEVVRMTLSVFMNLLQNKDIAVSSPMAPKLAEALRPLFDNDNREVQLLSIHLYKEMMESVVGKGKKPLKIFVSQSLLPLFFHCHDGNQRVAEASWKTLLCAVSFLKRRNLKQLLKMDDPWSFGERVLEEDRSRAPENLRQALLYLESPQEPVREAAVRCIGEPQARGFVPPCPTAAGSRPGAVTGSVFPGIAAMLMRGQPEELQLICEALQALSTDDSPSNTNLNMQVMLDERAAVLRSSGSKEPGQQQTPCKRRSPGDPRKSAGAHGTADAGHA